LSGSASCWPTGGWSAAARTGGCWCGTRPGGALTRSSWAATTARCGCPASRVPVYAAAVRCPVSGVRCPMSGVRGFPRPLSPAGRLWRVAAGVGGPISGMAGAGVVACGVHGQFIGCPVGTWRSRLAQICWVSGGVSLDLAVVGGGWAVARSTAWATRIGWMGAGIARWWRAGAVSEAATTLRGHRARPRAESPGRCEPPGPDCDLRVRPWCGRSLQ
jgi:hypothetical protein